MPFARSYQYSMQEVDTVPITKESCLIVFEVHSSASPFNAVNMRPQALPSPYGLTALLIRSYAMESSSRVLTSRTIRSWLVPTRWTVPLLSASGRSVVLRITRTGLPRPGASSWMPPESVRTMVDFSMR